jgi:hypothetical protein
MTMPFKQFLLSIRAGSRMWDAGLQRIPVDEASCIYQGKATPFDRGHLSIRTPRGFVDGELCEVATARRHDKPAIRREYTYGA